MIHLFSVPGNSVGLFRTGKIKSISYTEFDIEKNVPSDLDGLLNLAELVLQSGFSETWFLKTFMFLVWYRDELLAGRIDLPELKIRRESDRVLIQRLTETGGNPGYKIPFQDRGKK